MDDAESQQAANRPGPVTALCLLVGVALLAGTLRIAARWAAFRELTPLLQTSTALALAITFATLVAYWRMRRWGLWLIAVALAGRVALGASGAASLRWTDIMLPVILLVTGLFYARRLR